MVRARGDATNAGWQKRGAVGAFLPTVLFSSSAFRQNTESNVNGFLASAGTYQFNTGLSASVDLFTGFRRTGRDRKSTRLNSSHGYISYAVFCLKKKKNEE